MIKTSSVLIISSGWKIHYCIAGKFGEGEVWQSDSFLAFGKRKFGELIDQPIDY